MQRAVIDDGEPLRRQGGGEPRGDFLPDRA
jgi:hypothetical protein